MTVPTTSVKTNPTFQCGWYAIEDDGDLSSGPFSNREKCVRRITQPTDQTGAAKLQRLLN